MKIKVLVVDDNAVQVELLKKYFNGSDKINIVASASNGEEAIKLLEKETDYDIMLLDIVMPIKDGFSVLDYMKESSINKSIIVLSAFNEEETIRRVSEYGVKYYALKPFDMKRLESIIISLSDSIKSNNELFELQDKGVQIQVTNILHIS